MTANTTGLWALRNWLEHHGYDVDGVAGGPYALRGHGLATMAHDDDALAALADPVAHAERRFQAAFPLAAAARDALVAAGHTVTRRSVDVDVFAMNPRPDADVTLEGLEPEDLRRLADRAPHVAYSEPSE